MSLVNLTFQHGQTLEEARRRLETTVHQVSGQFGALVRRVEWSADRNRVKLEGVGFWAEMWVDPQAVHATGDVPILGGLLGSSLGRRLKQIVQQTFRKSSLRSRITMAAIEQRPAAVVLSSPHG